MKTSEIADLLRAELAGDGHGEIERVGALDRASTGDITFIEKNTDDVASAASCLIVPLSFAGDLPQPVIKTVNPKLAFSRIAAVLHPSPSRRGMVHSSALVRESAHIADGAFVGPFVCVDDNS